MSKGQEEKKHEQAGASIKLLWKALKSSNGFTFTKDEPILPVHPLLVRQEMHINTRYRLTQIGGHRSKKSSKKSTRPGQDFEDEDSWSLSMLEDRERRHLFGKLSCKFFTIRESIKMWQQCSLFSTENGENEISRFTIGTGSTSFVFKKTKSIVLKYTSEGVGTLSFNQPNKSISNSELDSKNSFEEDCHILHSSEDEHPFVLNSSQSMNGDCASFDCTSRSEEQTISTAIPRYLYNQESKSDDGSQPRVSSNQLHHNCVADSENDAKIPVCEDQSYPELSKGARETNNDDMDNYEFEDKPKNKMFRSTGELQEIVGRDSILQYQPERMEPIVSPTKLKQEMKEQAVEGLITGPSISPNQLHHDCVADSENDAKIPVCEDQSYPELSKGSGETNNDDMDIYELNENETTINQKQTFEQAVKPEVNESETYSIDKEIRNGDSDIVTTEDQPLPSFCYDLPSQEMSSSSSDDSDSASGISFTITIPYSEDTHQTQKDATKELSNVDNSNTMSPDKFKNKNSQERDNFFSDPDNDQEGQHSTTNPQLSSPLTNKICPHKRRRANFIEESETKASRWNDENLTLSLSETPIATKNNYTKKIKFVIIDEEEETFTVKASTDLNVHQAETESLSQRHIDVSNDLTDTPNQEKTPFCPRENLNGFTDLTDTPDQGNRILSPHRHEFNSSNLSNTPSYEAKERKKAKIEKLAKGKRQGKPERCIYVDEEAECDSDSCGDDYESLEDNHAQSQNSFINDSSQLGISQDQDLSQDQNITSHRQVDALNVEQSLYSTPMLRRKNQLTQSCIPSSEKALGKMNFIKSVLEHHRKGGDSNDIEREYNRLLRDSKNSQGSAFSEDSVVEQTLQACDSNDTKRLTNAKPKLTEEQLARIARNRERALMIRRSRLEKNEMNHL